MSNEVNNQPENLNEDIVGRDFLPEAEIPADAPQVVIHQHFLNDLSVENPAGILDGRAAEATLGQRITVDVAPRAGDPEFFKLGQPTHQVTVGLQLSATLEGAIIFLAEMRYRALVEIRNLPVDELDSTLFVVVPEAIFPAVKEVLERTGGYAGYPTLVVQPIDFKTIYAQSAQKKEEGVSLH